MYRTSTLSAVLSIRPASYVVSVRAVGASPRTSSPTGCYLPAVASCPPHGNSPLQGKTLMGLANQPYSRRLLCSSGLGFRIITVPCGLSPQFAYRVGRTEKTGTPSVFMTTPREPALHESSCRWIPVASGIGISRWLYPSFEIGFSRFLSSPPQ